LRKAVEKVQTKISEMDMVKLKPAKVRASKPLLKEENKEIPAFGRADQVSNSIFAK